MKRNFTDEDCQALFRTFIEQTARLLAQFADQIGERPAREKTPSPPTPPQPHPTPVVPSSPRNRYVRANELLEMLWDEKSRPSLRWLRQLQARRQIPWIKIGRAVFFAPDEVRAALKRYEVKARLG